MSSDKIKLSIALVRENFSDEGDIVNNKKVESKVNIDGLGTLYVKKSVPNIPSWVSKFFISDLPKELKIIGMYPGAILVVKVPNLGSQTRFFAISFGYSKGILKTDIFEERFGLKIVLNTLKPDTVKSIDRKSMDSMHKLSREQLSKSGEFTEFGIDPEKDVIEAVVGESKDSRFGNIIAGRDIFSSTVFVNKANLIEYLKISYEKYESTEYKDNFDWIDRVVRVKSKKKALELDGLLINKINQRDINSIWLAIPEIIKWENINGFTYSIKNKNDIVDDLSLPDFLDKINKEITIDDLKNQRVYGINSSSEQEEYEWSVYKCLYAEVIPESENRLYILSNGDWYEVEKDFVDQVNQDFISFPKSSFSLPAYNHADEKSYNLAVEQSDSQYRCLDSDTIQHGGSPGGIEFCDLYRKDKKIIHVKRYGNSSVLSHLFSQGLVSAELTLSDPDFRKKVNEKLPDQFKFTDPLIALNAKEYEVIFAIVSSSKTDLNIPFFSKVSLRNAKKRLINTFGFNVSILKIDNNK